MQDKQLSFLPELDRKGTQREVEAALERYRLYKYLEFEEREVKITPGYEPREHGPTNQTSDQTAEVAAHNVDSKEYRQKYCERIERSVRHLPRLERFLIGERYMSQDAEYITDHNVYNFKFKPPISEGTYSKIRWKAFYKLALALDIAVEKEEYEDGRY